MEDVKIYDKKSYGYDMPTIGWKLCDNEYCYGDFIEYGDVKEKHRFLEQAKKDIKKLKKALKIKNKFKLEVM